MLRFFQLLLVVLLTASLFVEAQRQRDPLTREETEKLRDVAQEPLKRIRLFLQFAQARMLAIDQLRSDPNFAPGRGKKMHEMISDLTIIVDELADNLEMYHGRQDDLRRALRETIEGMAALQLRVRALHEAATTDQALTGEVREYQFVLENLVDAVNGTADTARDLLEEQNAAAQAAKEERRRKK